MNNLINIILDILRSLTGGRRRGTGHMNFNRPTGYSIGGRLLFSLFFFAFMCCIIVFVLFYVYTQMPGVFR